MHDLGLYLGKVSFRLRSAWPWKQPLGKRTRWGIASIVQHDRDPRTNKSVITDMHSSSDIFDTLLEVREMCCTEMARDQEA